MAKQETECSGECIYLEQWVDIDKLRDFETIEFRWYDGEKTVVKQVSGPGRDALLRHAAELKVGRWIKACKTGCHCDGKWQKEEVIEIILVDYVYGANATCIADLHRKRYVGKCVPNIDG